MKPSWGDLPNWANWMWIGASGNWLYSYKRPNWSYIFGSYDIPCRSKWDAVPKSSPLEWNRKIIKSSLEQRP